MPCPAGLGGLPLRLAFKRPRVHRIPCAVTQSGSGEPLPAADPVQPNPLNTVSVTVLDTPNARAEGEPALSFRRRFSQRECLFRTILPLYTTPSWPGPSSPLCLRRAAGVLAARLLRWTHFRDPGPPRGHRGPGGQAVGGAGAGGGGRRAAWAQGRQQQRQRGRMLACPCCICSRPHLEACGDERPASRPPRSLPCRRRVEADGLCSLRLREPCEWEGALYQGVGVVEPVPFKTGVLDAGGTAASPAASNPMHASRPACLVLTCGTSLAHLPYLPPSADCQRDHRRRAAGAGCCGGCQR